MDLFQWIFPRIFCRNFHRIFRMIFRQDFFCKIFRRIFRDFFRCFNIGNFQSLFNSSELQDRSNFDLVLYHNSICNQELAKKQPTCRLETHLMMLIGLSLLLNAILHGFVEILIEFQKQCGHFFGEFRGSNIKVRNIGKVEKI